MKKNLNRVDILLGKRCEGKPELPEVDELLQQAKKIGFSDEEIEEISETYRSILAEVEK